MHYSRYVIIGKSGSGKTSLAARIAHKLSLNHIELDSIMWQPDWTPLSAPAFRTQVNTSLPADGTWVADGGYKQVRDIIWTRAEVLIWLDYSLLLTLWRLVVRTFLRIFRGVELWNGNREHVSNHLVLDMNENISLWMIASHWRHRRENPVVLGQSEYRHLKVLRFRRPQDTADWLASFDERSS